MRFISDGSTLLNLEKIQCAYRDSNKKKKEYYIYVDFIDSKDYLKMTYHDEESRDKFFQELTQALVQ